LAPSDKDFTVATPTINKPLTMVTTAINDAVLITDRNEISTLPTSQGTPASQPHHTMLDINHQNNNAAIIDKRSHHCHHHYLRIANQHAACSRGP
jgi:hypothetical protein